ncbi:unnamed protein product, partial [Ectocarpus sp. 4 AP-2014]
MLPSRCLLIIVPAVPTRPCTGGQTVYCVLLLRPFQLQDAFTSVQRKKIRCLWRPLFLRSVCKRRNAKTHNNNTHAKHAHTHMHAPLSRMFPAEHTRHVVDEASGSPEPGALARDH